MIQTWMAQALTDGVLAGRRGSSRVREALIARGDPPVEFDVDGTRLRLPLSHGLPSTRRIWPLYAENLGEVARQVFRLGGRTMIDVGANVGDSAAIVKARAPEMAILCIDADPVYLPYLRFNTAQWADVEIAAPVLLAERTGDVSGELERGQGTSRFLPTARGSVPAISLGDLLRDRSRFTKPALVKSDTDGFEEQVLRGAASVLAQSRPVLFLEYAPRLLRSAGGDGLGMLAWLRSIGYDRAVFYDKYGSLMVHCSLKDEALLRDLDAYAARNAESGVDHYDIVMSTPEFAPVLGG